jgi:hypothetical protein
VLIVGLHFFAFRIAGVWKRSVTVPATLVVFGLAGFGLAASSDPEWTSFISGVLSGFTLLTGSIYAISRELRGERAGDRAASRDPARPTRAWWRPARLRNTVLFPAARLRLASSDHQLARGPRVGAGCLESGDGQLSERLIHEMAAARSSIARSYFLLWAHAERLANLSNPEHRIRNGSPDAQVTTRRTDRGRQHRADR